MELVRVQDSDYRKTYYQLISLLSTLLYCRFFGKNIL